MNNMLKLSEVANKHYDTLEEVINELAGKCVGGEETTLHFPAGRITIKLK